MNIPVRYDLVRINCGYDGHDHVMEPCEDGEWVRWEEAAPKGNIKAALAVLFAECDQQPDVMVFEIHKDIISAMRAAVNG